MSKYEDSDAFFNNSITYNFFNGAMTAYLHTLPSLLVPSFTPTNDEKVYRFIGDNVSVVVRPGEVIIFLSPVNIHEQAVRIYMSSNEPREVECYIVVDMEFSTGGSAYQAIECIIPKSEEEYFQCSTIARHPLTWEQICVIVQFRDRMKDTYDQHWTS